MEFFVKRNKEIKKKHNTKKSFPKQIIIEKEKDKKSISIMQKKTSFPFKNFVSAPSF